MQKKLLHAVHKNNGKGHEFAVEFWAGEVAEVFLLDYPINARETLSRATRGYTGNYTNDEISDVEVAERLHDLRNTKLGTPAEMLNFVFLVRDVPRSWTHQAVRTRIGAAVVQESTRFIGALDTYKVLVPKTMHNGTLVNGAYAAGNVGAIHNYEVALTYPNAASQDARNLLPHSVLTHMFWSLNLRALMGIYEVRWCCQAEPSTWLPIMKQMKTQIVEACGVEVGDFLSAPIHRGQPCGFNASFDRPCEWKKR